MVSMTCPLGHRYSRSTLLAVALAFFGLWPYSPGISGSSSGGGGGGGGATGTVGGTVSYEVSSQEKLPAG